MVSHLLLLEGGGGGGGVKNLLGLGFIFGDMQSIIYRFYAKEQACLDFLTNDL